MMRESYAVSEEFNEKFCLCTSLTKYSQRENAFWYLETGFLNLNGTYLYISTAKIHIPRAKEAYKY